jgi:hypothetical protein
MTNNCDICIEKYNNTTRKIITCEDCNYSACQTCYKQNILNSTKYAVCMNCNKEFSNEFMMTNFSKTFMNREYKQHCKTILLNIEKSLLPATQPIIERINHEKRIKQEIEKMNAQVVELNTRIHELRTVMHNFPQEIMSFVKKCENSGCNGYLNKNWQCGVCEKSTCSQCHEIIDNSQQHVCNSNTIKSIQVIKQDSKMCPGCSFIIHKINGCNQIYCTNCKTVFDWETGKIQKGVIHNPHYFEEVRERNLLDVIQCGREIDHVFINSLRKIYNKMNIDFSHLEMSLRNISYIQYEVLPKFHNGFNDNQDLRIRYLQNLITEEQFKQTLLSRKRKSDKNKEISVILHTFLTSIIDLFHRFKHDLREFLSNVDNRNFIRLQKFHDDFYFEIDNLIMYINSCFQNVTEKYNSKTKYSIASIVFTFYSVSLD